MCISGMKQRKVRTFLTILGVGIGVVSIVSLLALGIGIEKEMLDDMEKSGVVRRITVYGPNNMLRKDKMLTDRKVEEMEKIDHVEAVYPILTTYFSMRYGKYDIFSEVIGVPRAYMNKLELINGVFPEEDSGKPQLLMGENVLDIMFPSEAVESYREKNKEDEDKLNLSGKKVDLEYNVENVDKRDRLLISGMVKGYDYSLYMDVDQLKKYLKRNMVNGKIYAQPVTETGENYREWIYSGVYVDVDDVANVDEVTKKLQNLGFQAESEKEYVESIKRNIRIAQILLGGIGMIALIVAVIGIGNTMTTSVFDRISEIGMLKVLGCDTDDLLLLFLMESGIIGGIGGIIGVAVSYGVTELGVNKLGKLFLNLELPENAKLAVIPIWLAFAAVAFAILLGILAGFFPARWAAKLKPIEAVRKG